MLTVTKADEDLETCQRRSLRRDWRRRWRRINAMRAVEGQKLAEDIASRLDAALRTIPLRWKQRSPETVAEYRAKLTARMQEVLQSTTIDPQRILTGGRHLRR